jgi:DinB family protein
MIADYPDAPPRLAPFLAQWDWMSGQLLARLEGLTDDELLWEPAPAVLTVRRGPDGKGQTDAQGLAPDARVVPPRTLAWSIGHLGAGALVRADWLTGSHSLSDEDVEWPMTAKEAVALLRRGLTAWRDGIGSMTDADLDTVGRSAYPDGLDPQLPLLDIVWWVNKELVEHASEIWYVRDLYAAR